MAIPQHIIEQLTDSADLVSIIGRHCTLKKSGMSFKGCCPFHKEKTPSFYVHPDKGYYNCFGCKESGNAISFLMNYEGMAFLEAVDTLSAQTGIAIPKNEPSDKFNYTKTKKTSSAGTSTTKQTPQPTASERSSEPTYQPANALPNSSSPQDTSQPATSAVPAIYPPAHEPLGDMAFDGVVFDDGFEPDYDSYQNNFEPSSFDPMPEPPAYLSEQFPPSSFTEASTSPIHEQSMHTPTMHEQAEPNASGNLYELLERICDYYQSKLKTNPKALLYLNQRGLSEQTLETFRLGYAPNDWQHLEKAFPQDIEGLKILGLMRENDSGRQYDLLRDRVIFPIRNPRGRVIGFGGRAMSNDVQPKYINSPESIVFKKQTILYGLHEGRKAKAKDWLIVEGYMDVIALYQAGIYGAVASMGTATNADQLKKLFSYNPVLTLAFDGDKAGQAAAWRTLELGLPIMEDAYELKFLLLPEGDDPDSLIKSKGVDAMQELLDSAPSLSEFLYAQLSNQFDLRKPEGKSKLMGAAKKLLDTLPQYGSYKKLLTNDLRERVGIGYSPNKKKRSAQATDLLLDFKSNYSLEEQIIFLLLTAPQLVEQTVSLQAHINNQRDSSSDANENALHQLITLIYQTNNQRSSLSSQNILTQGHFLLTAWHTPNMSQTAESFAAFYTQLCTLQNNRYTAMDMTLTDYCSQFLNELCLQYEEQLLTLKLKQANSLAQTKELNDALSDVRRKLQFRESTTS